MTPASMTKTKTKKSATKASPPAKKSAAVKKAPAAKKASAGAKAPSAKKAATNGAGLHSKGAVTLMIGTAKGLFFLKSDAARSTWKFGQPMFFGHVVHHVVLDPRDGKTLLAAVKTGHLGPTIFRSLDGGKTWKEAAKPPAFPKVPEGEKGRAVDHVFWLAPGHASQPGVWWAGTTPHGLFRSADGGETWQIVRGWDEHPMRATWSGPDGPPDGAKMHSIQIDPRDANHMYLCLSMGGVFESTDGAKNWAPLNKGQVMDYAPGVEADYGHDPHLMRMHPANPDRLYQQNHCGIYRMDRAEAKWVRVGRNMPPEVGDIGFPVVVHPRDPDKFWVFPMDGTEVWPRTGPGGKPAVYESRDAGETWKRRDKGFPKSNAWFTVYRQSMVADAHDSVGVYLGTTSGQIWASVDEGATWNRVAEHLPRVFCVEVMGLPR